MRAQRAGCLLDADGPDVVQDRRRPRITRGDGHAPAGEASQLAGQDRLVAHVAVAESTNQQDRVGREVGGHHAPFAAFSSGR